jgi:excisionase family DNA binding protein
MNSNELIAFAEKARGNYEEIMLRVGDAAKLLAASRSFIYKLMDSGQLAYAKFGKARRIPRQALLEYIKKHTVGSAC